MALTEDLRRLPDYRESNPQLSDLSDTDLADLIHKQTGDLPDLAKSSALSRTVAKGSNFFSDAGRSTENFLNKHLGDSTATKVGARAANMAVTSAPAYAINALAGRVLPQSRMGAVGLGALNFGLGYAQSAVEGGDTEANLGAGTGNVISLLGALAGGSVGRKYGGGVGGFVGATAGSLPGQAVAIGTSEGGFKDFLSDPLNLPATLLSQLPYGALDHAMEQGKAAKFNRDKAIAETPTLDDISGLSKAAEYDSLQKIPVSELSEQSAARIRQLATDLGRTEEQRIAQRPKGVAAPEGTMETVPESDSAILSQIKMMNRGQKQAVFIPAGQEAPTVPYEMQKYLEHTTDKGLFLYNPDMTNPDAINDALAKDSVGNLLGYGTPNKPKDENGYVGVLRDKNGNEKMGVVLGFENEAKVLHHLGTLREPGDQVTREPIKDALAKRVAAQGLIKTYQLPQPPEVFPPGQRAPIDNYALQARDFFKNTLLDNFQRALTPTATKGARFQLDANGDLSVKGAKVAIEQWAPKEMLEHYKQAGLDDFLSKRQKDTGESYAEYSKLQDVIKKHMETGDFDNPEMQAAWKRSEEIKNTQGGTTPIKLDETNKHKVNFQELSNWIQDNTPKIEVKKLIPDGIRSTAADAQHRLETMGYTLADGDEYFGAQWEKEGKTVNKASMPDDVKILMDSVDKGMTEDHESDAATGRYGIEPIPVESMDRPVDILVRAPRSEDSTDKFNFTGPHFGDSDVNVLASVRGYMVGDTFHIFEVQSDWGQTNNRAKESAKPSASGAVNQEAANFLKRNNHPLLESYETLALKTAIQHALEQGATRIAISDGRTALTTEGHYEATNTPRQEAGMKAAYDERLPNIAKRLTGDKGTLVDLGQNQHGVQGGFNERIKARAYDITNLKPEVQNLFSLYGQQEQHDFATSLQNAKSEFEKRLMAGDKIDSGEFIDRVTNGENMDKALALSYIQGLVGNQEKITHFISDAVNGIKLHGLTRDKDIFVNQALDGRKAFEIFGHEASHVAANMLERSNPAAYKDFMAFPQSMTPEVRKNLIKQIYAQVGIDKADFDYLSGQRFDPKDPNLAQKQSYEFYGALSEALSHAVYEGAQLNSTISKYFSWLPMGAQRWLSHLAGQFTKFFGPQYPSLRHFLSGDEHEKLTTAYSKLVRMTHENEVAQSLAYQQLKRLDLFNDTQFIDKIPERNDPSQWAAPVRSLANASTDFSKYALEFLKESGLVNKVKDAYEDNFLSPLFRTKLHPELLPVFLELHHYRNKISNYGKGYMAFLGQNEGGTLSQEEAIRNTNKYLDGLMSPFGADRNKRLDAMSKVLAENNRIRDSLINPTEPGKKPVGNVSADQLVSKDDMVSKYGMTPDDADKLSRIIKIPQQVAEQSLRHMQQVDTTNVAKLFYLRNNKQNIDDVKNKVAELTRISNDAGAKILERKIYEKYMTQLKMSPDIDPARVQDLESRIYSLKQEEAQFSQIMENGIRQSFAKEIPFEPQPGGDSFITQATNLAFRLAESRAEQAFIMRDEGYAPMTRRGRFLVQTFKQGLDGGVMPGTTESMKGFKTKSEADKYRKENGLSDINSKLLDKETFAQRAELYNTSQLQAVRDKARNDLGDLVRGYAESIPESPDKPAMLKAVSDIMNQYHPLAQEIREVISAKGDKFKERRYNVKGFDEHDFLPNIFEYADYKTITGQKALTRAEVELQMLQPSVQQDPAMISRMQRELDYTLSHTSEATKLRKFIFYNYLGGSVRHMIQNLLQIPLNGIPEMMSQGAGMHAYQHAIKAGALAAKYLKDGTTGNKQFDVLLKQAEHDGITIPNAIEFFGSESSDLQHALDNVSSYDKGTTTLGEKTSYANTKFWQGFEKFMRSTAVASEQTNRRISFIMSMLESQRTGITDPRAMFNKANVFTDYVNFVGDKSNRPGFQVKLGQTWAHAPVLVATALQSFVFNHISQLYAYGKLAMKGDVNYQKAFATGTLHLIAMAGAMGIPFAQNAEQLFEAVTGISLREAIRRGIIVNANDWFGLDQHNGGRIADTVLEGFPSTLGIEASQSIGLGDPLFHVEAGKTPTALDLAGPVGGLVGKYASGLSALKTDPMSGDAWRQATRLVAPQALNYWNRLSDAMMKGSYTDRGGAPVVENLNGSSSIALLGGFMPKEVGDIRKVQNLRRKIDDHISQNYETAVDQVAQKLVAFQQSQNPNDLTDANAYFANYLNKMANTQDRGTMVRSVAQRMQELKSPVNKPTNLKESKDFQEALSSYPDTKYPFVAQLPELFDELKSAQLLGQQDILAQRLRSLLSSVLQKALYDQLVQAGYEPSQASQFSSGGTQAARSMLRRQSPSSLAGLKPPVSPVTP